MILLLWSFITEIRKQWVVEIETCLGFTTHMGRVDTRPNPSGVSRNETKRWKLSLSTGQDRILKNNYWSCLKIVRCGGEACECSSMAGYSSSNVKLVWAMVIETIIVRSFVYPMRVDNGQSFFFVWYKMAMLSMEN